MAPQPVTVAFAAGTAVGACLALALARYALSPRRQWSWREWRSWRAFALGGSPPTSPTCKAWSFPEPACNGYFPSPFAPARPGDISTYSSYSSKSGAALMSSPPLHTVPELASQNDEIISEQFTRNEQFFGAPGQMRVHSAFVVVVGLGGVGSHAASMLLRAGVGRLRVIDFDQVSLSSLNRHAVATRADVGTPKATCLRTHFARIFPEAEVEAHVAMLEAGSVDELLAGEPDFVLDCIDNIDTKVALLAACKQKGLAVLSATGAGARADPTRIRIADISESSTDPLSRAGGVPVVFSSERPKSKLLPFEPPQHGGDSGLHHQSSLGAAATPGDYQVVPGFRVRVIPVLGTIPAMFGQAMASHVLTQLAGMAVRTEPVLQLAHDHYATLHRRLVEREELLFGSACAVEVDVEDVMYVVKELWRGRSARDQGTREVGRGMFRSMNHMTLTRWDQTQPPSITNLVLLTFDEAEHHEGSTLQSIKEHEPVYFSSVASVLARAWEELCA
eukprot:jgi/Mesen1/3778/ME000205S03031